MTFHSIDHDPFTISFTADGKGLCDVGRDGLLRFWRVEDGSLGAAHRIPKIQKLYGLQDSPMFLFSPRRTSLVEISPQRVRVFDLRDFEVGYDYKAPSGFAVTNAALATNERTLYVSIVSVQEWVVHPGKARAGG